MGYEEAGQELKRRIMALIPDHPEIMDLPDPWGLFKVPGFECGDLQPSYAMAGAAMDEARREYLAKTKQPADAGEE